ncbi:MAG: hypothetical protein N3D11_13085 [Candidatus Sumerlaeia bacterium]|nr:hypothetical protein [Candidatus Sumerlaeia bacterium]
MENDKQEMGFSFFDSKKNTEIKQLVPHKAKQKKCGFLVEISVDDFLLSAVR